MEAEPFPVVEDAAKFRGEVAQRIVREFHRVRGEHRRGHRADLYAHAGEDRDRHRQRGAPETRHVMDRGDSGDWIAHSETPGKGLDGGGKPFFRRVSLPRTPSPFQDVYVLVLGKGGGLFLSHEKIPYTQGLRKGCSLNIRFLFPLRNSWERKGGESFIRKAFLPLSNLH